VLTTAISLETGKGEVALSLALGFILVALALIVTVLANRFLKVKEADVAQSRAPTS
jgi:ABC-type tungstate transport system substrate-binding protein